MITKKEVINRFEKIHNFRYDYSKFEYNGMHKKSCIVCAIHGEFWQTPHDHLKGHKCPKCALCERTEKRKYTTEKFIEKAKEVHGDKFDYKKVNYIDSQTKVCIICPEHGEFWQKPYLHLQGDGCMQCYNERRGDTLRRGCDVFLKDMKNIYGDLFDFSNFRYVNSSTKSCIKCSKHGLFYRSPYDLYNGKNCPECTKNKIKEDKKNMNGLLFVEKAKFVHNNRYDYSKVKYVNSNTLTEIICPKHGSFWQKPSYHISGNGCQLCASEMVKSKGETEMANFIKTLGFNIKENCRDVIYPMEIDVYSKELRLGIEYDGLRWHNEVNKEKFYHLNKTLECEKNKIRLIHIFEDEWLYKQNIVKSRIRSLFGIIDKKIYARKCVIREIDYNTSKIFLENNHIQGNCISKVRYGLYYDDELVSVMTFGKKRLNLGNRTDGKKYELLRFCNKVNITVVGGASKLLKKFINDNSPSEITTYCDRRWSDGKFYEKLGFTKCGCSKPSYFYIKGDKRVNRFNYRKDVLIREGFDKDKSEHEIMMERGIYRIYDCGCFVFKMKTDFV